jgi:non-ribosomal peptide synthetase component F
MLESGWEQPLNIKALVGGEPVQISLAHELLSDVVNYGIFMVWQRSALYLLRISNNDNPITIGKPIANTQIYLLDSDRNLVSNGKSRKIVIAGNGVSLGYLNRTELTNERFISNTFKVKCMGDLGKV